MIKDTFLYMIAKSIEGVVGIVTISMLSYIFTPEKYSDYILWNVLITTCAMMSIQWLSQSASRYLNDYEQRGSIKAKENFYSTVFFSWLKINVIVSIAFVILLVIASNLKGSLPKAFDFLANDNLKIMSVLAVLFFISYNTYQLLTALLSVKRLAFVNMVISVISSIGKLTLIFLFSKIKKEVEIIFISYIICDTISILIALFALKSMKYVKKSAISKELSDNFFAYGLPLVGNLATTTVLNNSDRYIIEHHLKKQDVSTYSTSYSVVSAAFTMISTAVMRGTYPTILKTYASGDKEETTNLISKAVRYYLLVSVPACFGIWAVSKPLANLLFAPEYREGYKVMVWVAVGMMFLGLTEYSNKPWELSAKTGYIFRNSLIGGAVNLTINIFLMPKFGYMTAAYSTFLGFFTYFCLSKIGSRKYIKWNLPLSVYVRIILSGAVMAFSIKMFTQLFSADVSKLIVVLYVCVGVIIYVLMLILTGEIKEEIEMVREKLETRD